jgi:hypothetical protein
MISRRLTRPSIHDEVEYRGSKIDQEPTHAAQQVACSGQGLLDITRCRVCSAVLAAPRPDDSVVTATALTCVGGAHRMPFFKSLLSLSFRDQR